MEWLREGNRKGRCLRIQELRGKDPSFKLEGSLGHGICDGGYLMEQILHEGP